MTQFESERAPARFCQTPIWEFSVSSLRHVSEGEGDLQHFLSFALRIAERDFDEDEGDEDEDVEDDNEVIDCCCEDSMLRFGFLLSACCGTAAATGKFVFAFRPLISTAASS